MLDLLHRELVQPLVALRRRSSHLSDLAFLEKHQYEEPETIAAFQLDLLKQTLRYAWEHVPYYRRAWQAAGLHPDAFKQPADLAAFPVLTKADIRAHTHELHSDLLPRMRYRHKSTSGSTGVPLRLLLDERGAAWKTAITLRSDEWSGWQRGQTVAKIWGNPEFRHEGLRGWLRNKIVDRAIYLDTIQLNDRKIQDFALTLRQAKPGLIFGHAHSLYLVACRLKALKIDDLRPHGIISTAMPLHAWQRSVIEDVFGTRATNRYGCEEVSLIASECEHHDGLHIAAESVFTEMEPDGKLLVSDLSNFAMPLIRYRIGDVVKPMPPGVGRCRCARGLPRLAAVQGREADYVLTPAGNLISGISLTENFAMLLPGTAQLQIVQESRTHLRLRIVKDAEFTDAARRKIAQLVRELFGPSMTFELEFLSEIPQEPSGKYRFCISQVATAYLQSLSV